MDAVQFADLFSGAGGLSYGFRSEGFKPIFALDVDPVANESYRLNLGVRPRKRDAFRVSPRQLTKWVGDVDVLLGCPPCKGFSTLNRSERNRGLNRLVLKYAKFALALRPKVIVFENVPGILYPRNKEYFYEFVQSLKGKGYNVVWGALNAADYGVPQLRKRVVVIASLRGKPELPERTHGKPDSEEVREGLLEPWVTVRQTIGDLSPVKHGERDPRDPLHVAKKLPENHLRLIRAIPKDGGSRFDAPEKLWLQCHRRSKGFRDVFGRLWWDRPSVTIRTKCYDPSTGRYVHPEQDRGLTLRECARLQSFPDDYKFSGRSVSEIARQIGEAFPPLLARAIARKVKELL